MFAALSATNEAIMRAKSRDELFELVCESVAKGGKFTSTTIALKRPGSDYLDMVAVAGPSRGEHEKDQAFDQRRASGRARTERHRLPHQRGLHQQRLSGSDPPRHCVSPGGSRRRREIRRGVSPDRAGGSRRRHAVSVGGDAHLHRRVRRTAAAAGRQRLLCAGEFRPRRREAQGGRAHRISCLARQPDRPAEPRDVQRAAPSRDRGRAPQRAATLRCCSSISTASRSSTIRSATTPATCCWWKSPAGCAARCAPATSWRGSAATNSSSFSRRLPSRDDVERIARNLLSVARPADAVERPRVPHHGLHRHRDVSRATAPMRRR